MVAGPSVLSCWPAAPSLTCPQTPALRREADGRGRFRPPPQVNLLGEWREALVGPRAYFTIVPGNAPTSGSVVTTPDILARHVSATVPPQLIKRSPVSMCLSNDGQLGIHMFHVKPGLTQSTFSTVSATLSSPRIMGSPVSATVFHVKHDRRPSISPHQWLFSEEDGGAETLSVSAPPRFKDQRRLFLVKRRSRRQRIDQASEVLIARELNGDTPLLRSTCHLHTSVEGIGQPG